MDALGSLTWIDCLCDLLNCPNSQLLEAGQKPPKTPTIHHQGITHIQLSSFSWYSVL
jgi:hypothetical protein